MFRQWFKSQRGAMFGLDARVALAVFGGLATVSAGYIGLNIPKYKAQAFTQEIRDIANAIELIHKDLKEDLHNSLDTVTDQNAIIALFDDSELASAADQVKWSGPYIDRETDVHIEYGNIRLTKAQDDASTACSSGNRCYLWLTFDNVPQQIAIETNTAFDGEGESSANTSGIFRWDSTVSATVTTSYRISKALEL